MIVTRVMQEYMTTFGPHLRVGSKSRNALPFSAGIESYEHTLSCKINSTPPVLTQLPNHLFLQLQEREVYDISKEARDVMTGARDCSVTTCMLVRDRASPFRFKVCSKIRESRWTIGFPLK